MLGQIGEPSMIIVSLIGLKKCGKTATAEALIREFKRRGYRVGGVKSMPHSKFTIDVEGKDTWRQKEAGADFVISLSKGELAYIERKEKRGKKEERCEELVRPEEEVAEPEVCEDVEQWATLENALRLVPDDTDILICEGLTQNDPRILRVVLAKSLELLEETFRVRGVETGMEGEGKYKREWSIEEEVGVGKHKKKWSIEDGVGEGKQEKEWSIEDEVGVGKHKKEWSIEDGTKVEGDRAKIIALSGIMANEVKEHPDYPVFNCLTKEGVEGLVELILEK